MSSTTRLFRRLAILIASAALIFTTATVVAPSPARALPCGKVSGCTSFELVSAGAHYNWYPLVWRYEYKGGRKAPKTWKLSGPGRQYQQNGMLTIVGKSGKHTKPVASTYTGKGASTGRWESRMRTKSYAKGAQYAVELALVPTKKSLRACGNRDIEFLHFNPKKPKTYKAVAHAPSKDAATNLRFSYTKKLGRKIGGEEWHVFGVELTKKHIVWFVDGRAVAKEKRAAARTGLKYTMQARLVPTSTTKKLAKTRLQLDWSRHWSMKKKGKKLPALPGAHRSASTTTC